MRQQSRRIAHFPAIAICDSALAIWGGTRIYVGSLLTGSLERFELDDEIHAAFRVAEHWCLVCETSVFIWEPVDGIVAQYQHSEVLMSMSWSDDSLRIQDFQGRTLTFHPASFRSGFVPEIEGG